ncbi:MAG: tRNA lysidine(34) synthetase TilS [Terriglobales bacterium]
MHELSARLLKTIRGQELIRPGDRVAVAVSGGADSVALLRLLVEIRAELGILLSVAHVNHKLRGEESDEDERFVAELARQLGLELHSTVAPLEPARESGTEAAARHLRYDFFCQLARAKRASKIATAHTLDDQSETVLLRILRGTGLRGLSGIHPRFILKQQGQVFGEVVRPLLGFRRAELGEFLLGLGQNWREDSSNRDLNFLRNRVRHLVVPVLKESFGATAVENLADLAEIARGEEEHWNQTHPEIHTFRGPAPGNDAGPPPVEIARLRSLPLAAQRRLVREWLETNASGLTVSFRIIEAVLDLARGPAGERIELAGGCALRRTQRDLRFEPAREKLRRAEYEYRLPVPGQIEIPELGIRIEAVLADRKGVPEPERERLLDPAQLPKEVRIRNWRPGDRFWPLHTKSEKKMKELLADRRISGMERKLWPVAVAEGIGLVWARGFAVPASLQSLPGAATALWIRESPSAAVSRKS